MENSQAQTVRELRQPLRRTPIIRTSHAVVEGLDDLASRYLSFPCYPNPEIKPDPTYNDRIKQLWQCSEEAVVLQGLGRRSRRPRHEFSFRALESERVYASTAQNGEHESPTPPSPIKPDTATVPDIKPETGSGQTEGSIRRFASLSSQDGRACTCSAKPRHSEVQAEQPHCQAKECCRRPQLMC
ncbi:hypothetical protein EKO04_005870 [Ascochyta lentis]|uniref:Uncharacterized protein n=1 Tax=Ascochyta lentis TaxID=205686 RepID=A0A8H7J495_9PLEO|nr:hypothetical protein EKO04_005870 [Ascochyta lentis]